MKKLLVFASGSTEGGGSGFQKLVEAFQNGTLQAEIVGVVSNHRYGGVKQRAKQLGVSFIHFPGPWTAEKYQKIAKESGADFFALSGWLKLVVGLDLKTSFNSKTVFNIHPGFLPDFGGPGLYGHHVHEAVMAAFRRKEITHSAVSMHFVSEATTKDDYDRVPVFFSHGVKIHDTDTPETLARRINLVEHEHQARITNLVVTGKITWDGVNQDSLCIEERSVCA